MPFRFLILVSALFCAGLTVSPGDAATLYVSASGSSANCTGANPCSSLSDAMTAANPGDTIVCLSPPIGVGVTINKSITIDCSGTRSPVRGSAVGIGSAKAGISINIAVSADDPLRKVRLRGLTVDGAIRGNSSPSGRTYDRGIEIVAATAVYIEDCVISNVNQTGIYDQRSGGQTKLFIKDSVISGAGGAGIVAASAATGITVLDNVTSENNGYGIAVATGNNVQIDRSVISGNTTAGIEGDPGAKIVVTNSTITHNNAGVESNSSVRLRNNNISFNNTAVTGASATLGGNSFSGNGAVGTTPTPVPGAPSYIGP